MASHRNMGAIRHRPAFTLIELLVVIGLIAVIAGGIGMALGRGDRGNSLKTAQGTFSSVLSGARAQAALNSTDGGIFINADPSSDGFLREIRLAVDSTGSGNWQIKGDPIMLPSGIFFVPKDGVFTSAQAEKTGDWSKITITNYSSTGITLKDSANTSISSSAYHLICKFSVQGNVSSGSTTTGIKLALSPAELQSGGKVLFDKPDLVRGVVVSKYGVPSFINDPDSF